MIRPWHPPNLGPGVVGWVERVFWGALWALLAVAVIAWVVAALVYGMIVVIWQPGFGGTNGAGVVYLYAFTPATLLLAWASLARREFDVLTTAAIFTNILAAMWLDGRLPLGVVWVQDSAACVALVNAVVQRRLSASSAFLIGLALVATVWVATQGQLTHYELTY